MILRALGFLIACILVLALAGVGVAYVGSERVLDLTYEVPLVPVTVPTDSSSVAEGQRLARVLGCYNGCHGVTVEGQELFNRPGVARVVTPNLTRIRHDYTDSQFARLIRHGVRNDGRSVFIMPSDVFNRMSDRDIGRIVAFIRSLPDIQGEESAFEVRLLGRLGLAVGALPPMAQAIDHTELVEPAPATGDTLALGRYVARIACAECHGLDLEGGDATPALTVVAGYSRANFQRLLQTGVPADGRELSLMADVARKRFIHLTDEEIDGLYRYLGRLDIPTQP